MSDDDMQDEADAVASLAEFRAKGGKTLADVSAELGAGDILSIDGWKHRLRGATERTVYACATCDSRTFKLSCTKSGDAWGAIVVECANCETPQTFNVELHD